MRWLLGLSLVISACAHVAVPTQETLRGLRYTVTADATLDRLHVSLCFDGQPPSELVYGHPKAASFLAAAHVSGSRQPLPLQRGKLQLPRLAADSCIEYTVDLQKALAFDALLLVYPGERALLVGTDLFLWRPVHRSPQLQARLRFAGAAVSTPWPDAADGSYRLDERAFAFTGHIVLGHFESLDVPVPGGQLHARLMPGFSPALTSSLTAWLARSASAASLPGGVFPVPNAQVILVPTSPSPLGIHFGHTGRSGGASIVLFVPTDTTDQQLQSDWIAVHEFSHLWHPFIRREDAWLSEGLATYLQEILRARAGLIAPSVAWQRLYEGALLGRESTHSLADETRRMAYEPNYRRVYWAGAAIALLIDVELRKASRGELSLPVLLGRLHADRALFMRGVSASELLLRLDRLAGSSTCEAVAERHLRGSLPDLGALYADLGIQVTAGALSFDDSAASAWVRAAIMQPAWQ